MATDSDDLPPDDLVSEQLVTDAVRAILETRDATLFLRWMQAHLGDYLRGGQFDQPSVGPLAVMLGRALWNATPLPWNKFKPAPLPEPGRNAPCPCGSGKKYKQCCGARIKDLPRLDAALVWPILVSLLPPQTVREAMTDGRIPPEALAFAAEDCLADGAPDRAVALLAPLFAGPPSVVDERADFALNLLCDAYDALEDRPAKLELLARVGAQAPRSPLRAGAWQRLATVRCDERDFDGAWQAFKAAMQDDPEAVALSALEVQILGAEQQWDKARERAAFWLRKLSRLPKQEKADSSLLFQFLQAVVANPEEALTRFAVEAGLDPAEVFADWLRQAIDRPLPRYAAGDGEAPVDGADTAALRQRITAQLQGMGVAPSEIPAAVGRLLPDLQAKAATTPEPRPKTFREPDSGLEIVTPPALQALEAQWRAVFPLDKPFGVRSHAMFETDPWDDDVAKAWLGFLAVHPEALDSLSILDDLAAASFAHEFVQEPDFRDDALAPLLRRAQAIVEAIDLAPDRTLPWGFVANRSALRCLVRLVTLHSLDDADEALEAAVRRYLRFNPNDNHGLRMFVINAHLTRQEDELALAFAAGYPDDWDLHILLGRALALYRLDRKEAAAAAVATAVARCPQCVHYLAAARVRQPKDMQPGTMSVGGPDQAWLYRQAMRAIWQGTPGALDWLRAQAPSPTPAKPKRKRPRA